MSIELASSEREVLTAENSGLRTEDSALPSDSVAEGSLP